MRETHSEPLIEDLLLDPSETAPLPTRLYLLRLLLLAVGAAIVLLAPRWIWPEAPSYATQQARIGDLSVSVTATGPLEPTEQVEVGSEIPGTLQSVDVGFNQQVHAGQVLAHLDPSRLEAQVRAAQAALASAQASALQARASEREAVSQLARLREVSELSKAKEPSQQELAAAEGAATRARGALRGAEAAVAQAQATLDLQRSDLARALIRAPIDGVVLAESARPGLSIPASLQLPPLFTLAGDLHELELDLGVDEADVGRVHEGQSARFSVDAWPGRTFSGRVEQVHYGARTQSGVVSYDTLVSVDNPDLLLRPGMTATAEIEAEKLQQVLLAPNAALRFEPKGDAPARGEGLARLFPSKHRFDLDAGSADARTPPHVWLLKQGQLRRIAVETGLSDGSWTEIRAEGLEPGARLVVDEPDTRG